tara:strand:+ start:5043 stop:5330 length:288 start_codon:yes stop_codon:yes gene_type:complete
LAVKSKLIKELKKSYPNFLNKDLEKTVLVILNEIKNAIKRSERVELRNFGVFYSRVQKESIRRNPKTQEKVNVPSKRTINFKMGKDLFTKLNNNE